jgi:predicted DNA-binding transcriptional regulator AlpA
MIKLLKQQLLKLLDDIDTGNTNINEEDALKICNIVKEFTRDNSRMSKYKAYTYLNVSRATFDNYVAQGLLPKGVKEAGYKELSWYKKDLDNFIKQQKYKYKTHATIK